MGVFKQINLYAFFISLAIGLLIVYIVTPIPKIVYKYPSPYNTYKIIYKTNNQICYKYKVKKVDCPKDMSKTVNQILE
tara:strand:+ start:778 stop:1011 length:234 start_codon:yes stop_codon:yes gene_type:complete